MLISLIFSFFFLTIPLLEIYFGLVYKDLIICETNIIPIYQWLIIKGTINIINVLLFITIFLSYYKSLTYCLIIPIVFLIKFFNLFWVIIGLIIFIRDCPLIKPKEINIFMYISLIIGIINIFNITFLNYHEKNYHEKKNKNIPILDV